MAAIKNLIGLKFGKLTPVSMIKEKGKRILWECFCDCGKKSVIVRSDFLNNGTTKSCGCIVRTRKGLCVKDRKTYQAWRNMIRRCYDPSVDSYELYHSRGIKVCVKWRKDFNSFYEDMGSAPKGFQLDRINNDGNYEPNNCRWVSPKQNCNNKRSNKLLTAFGKTQSAEMWANEYGLSGKVLRQRLDRDGWSIEEAISKSIDSEVGRFKKGHKRKVISNDIE